MMGKIVFYSNNCPKCLVLEQKLKEKKINYEKSSNPEPLIEKGIMGFPGLEVNGDINDFVNAVSWVNAQ